MSRLLSAVAYLPGSLRVARGRNVGRALSSAGPEHQAHPSGFRKSRRAQGPHAARGPPVRRRRRRRPTRAARPARATGTAPRAASSCAVSATLTTARLASRPAWPRRRRLRRTRPRTRAASRAKKTRTVTDRAASSGTRALSPAPVAPATVPSGTRRLRRPRTLLFLPARDPTSPRPLSSKSPPILILWARPGPESSSTVLQGARAARSKTRFFFRPHEVSPPTSASLEPASSSGTLEQRRTGSTFTGGWRHTKSGQPKAP